MKSIYQQNTARTAQKTTWMNQTTTVHTRAATYLVQYQQEHGIAQNISRECSLCILARAKYHMIMLQVSFRILYLTGCISQTNSQPNFTTRQGSGGKGSQLI